MSIMIVIQEVLLILCIPESHAKKEILQDCTSKIKSNIENIKKHNKQKNQPKNKTQ